MLLCPVCESIYPPDSHDRCPQDGAPLYVFGEGEGRRRIESGDIIADKYEIIEEIARRGGAGHTFRARQINLDREVELRLLPGDSLVKPGDHARFQREVQTWGRLRSDFLVRLYDSGFTQKQAPYLALEYVAGGTLGQRLRIAGPLRLTLLRTVAEHGLRALNAAHTALVLHRDISPDALVMGKRVDGTAYCRLTGFGLAKTIDDMEDDPTAITMTGQVIGDPAYMAPETVMRGVLDARTDLYALGVTLYELATGHRPLPGKSLAEMLAAHVRGVPEPITQYRTDLDAGLRIVIERLIRRDPADRFQSATEALKTLQDELAAWPDIGSAVGPVGPVSFPNYSPPKSSPRWWLWAGVSAAAIAVGVVFAWIFS